MSDLHTEDNISAAKSTAEKRQRPLVATAHVPEILAPAGGRAQFFAALNAGADAVFLGLRAFNARSRAENFTVDDLRELLPIARAHGMRVLVTVNVLIKEAELKDLVETLATLEALEVDAIIVQDLGVVRLARRFFPKLRLHASTQMAVHNLAGVVEAARQGLSRVVLARELTAQEMRKIRAAIPREHVELEAFCHGSLCYSYSGLCFFSGAEDARSGNRGECAYTCRQPYRIISEPGHGFLFSMRDLDTAASIEQLINAGIDTLKIEGRKKDAQYVATAVRLYRQALDRAFGRSTLRAEAPFSAHAELGDARDDLAYSFHRQTTSFFVGGRYRENVIDLDNPTHTGARLGTVTAIRGRRMSLEVLADVERFDGIRLVAARPVFHSTPQNNGAVAFGPQAAKARYNDATADEFSLRELFVGGKATPSAAKRSFVEIEIPAGIQLPAVGDYVFKTRSADLKRRVEKLAQPPTDARLRPFTAICVEVSCTAQEEELVVCARAKKLDHILRAVSIRVPRQEARSASRLADDVMQTFRIFGDEGLWARELHFTGEAGHFVPRSRLKDLKNLLAHELAATCANFLEARQARALASLTAPAPGKASAEAEGDFLSIKVDRLESLEHAAAWAKSRGVAIDEWCFEPKRAFLAELHPEALVARLTKIAAESGVPVRLALPTVVRAWDEPLLGRWVRALHEAGIARFEIGNLGGLPLLEGWGISPATADINTDFTAYSLSSNAARFWLERGMSSVCLSIEDDRQNIGATMASLLPEEKERMVAILYKDTPLFIAEACSLTALHDGCPTSKVCGYRTLEVENPKGERFFVAHESCKSIVYGKEAWSISHRRQVLRSLGVRRFRVDFLTRPYDEAGIGMILDAVHAGRAISGTHTANFDRELL